MRRIAEAVPAETRVTMLIEAFAPRQVHEVKVPDGVLVTWLLRGRGMFDDAPRVVRSRGDRLGAAVHAWCTEWAPGAGAPHATVWLAVGTPPRIARMVRAMLDVDGRRTLVGDEADVIIGELPT